MSLNIPDLLDREWQAFWLSVKSFTRLPTPHVAYSTVQMQRASSYLPWVGWLIGGICALAFLGHWLGCLGHLGSWYLGHWGFSRGWLRRFL